MRIHNITVCNKIRACRRSLWWRFLISVTNVCRLGPTESEVYDLENEGEEISRFRAQFTADFTPRLQKQDEKEKKPKDSNTERSVSLQTKTSSMRVLLGLSKGQMVR